MTETDRKTAGVKVLLGVSGGVAAYKAVDLASKLTASGYEVKTVMTENACELVGPKSFEAVTGGQVYVDMWADSEQYHIGHISLADWAEMVAVAPATADIIGKFANGICDDLLSTTLCACWQKPIVFAPAMNDRMWGNPAVQRNVKKIGEMGAQIIGPAKGRLACGSEGVGRMSEPADIAKAIETIATKK